MKVNLLSSDDFARILFKAMVECSGDNSFVKDFNIKRDENLDLTAEVEIIFKVNGKELYFTEEAVNQINSIYKNIEEEIKKAAIDLLDDELYYLCKSIKDVRSNLSDLKFKGNK